MKKEELIERLKGALPANGDTSGASVIDDLDITLAIAYLEGEE